MNAVQLAFPEPCSADWSAMAGDERRRFCESCGKHVTNLSRMHETAAREFLLDNPEACVQVEEIGGFYLFEPAPRTSRRQGWLSKAATVGALLSVGTPAFASGKMEQVPTYVQQAVEWVRSLVAPEVQPAPLVIIEAVVLEPTLGEPEAPVEPTVPERVNELKGRIRVDPKLLEETRAKREARASTE